MPSVVFFPHEEEEFESKYVLRNWLAGGLRLGDGVYHLREARGLGKLDKGSIVFFVREDAVVGCALVEKSLRALTTRERKELKRQGYTKKYKKIVKFFPDSIWAWSDTQFMDRKKAERIVGKGIGTRVYTKVGDMQALLKLFAQIS